MVRHIQNLQEQLVRHDHIYAKFVLGLYGLCSQKKPPQDIVETVLTMNKDFPPPQLFANRTLDEYFKYIRKHFSGAPDTAAAIYANLHKYNDAEYADQLGVRKIEPLITQRDFEMQRGKLMEQHEAALEARQA